MPVLVGHTSYFTSQDLLERESSYRSRRRSILGESVLSCAMTALGEVGLFPRRWEWRGRPRSLVKKLMGNQGLHVSASSGSPHTFPSQLPRSRSLTVSILRLIARLEVHLPWQPSQSRGAFLGLVSAISALRRQQISLSFRRHVKASGSDARVEKPNP